MKVDLNSWDKCQICGKPTQLGNLFAYKALELKKVEWYFRRSSVFAVSTPACYDCQMAYIDDYIGSHTTFCVDWCAYCVGGYDVIEHFTPVIMRGGTDADNCVPACLGCNSIKGVIDGRTQKNELAFRMNIPVGRLIEIESYLDTRQQ